MLDVANSKRVVSPETLPVSPGAHLVWLGFSDACVPLTFDSAGVLRMRDASFGGQWVRRRAHARHIDRSPINCQHLQVPMLETSSAVKSAAEWLWPVGCSGGQLLCVVTRGRAAPTPVPRPTLTPLPLAPPLARPEAAATVLERDALLQRVQLANATAARRPELRSLRLAHDAALVKLFVTHCKADRDARARELLPQLRFDKSLQIAARMAASLHREAVAEHIGELLSERAEANANDERRHHASFSGAVSQDVVAAFNGATRVVSHTAIGDSDDDEDNDKNNDDDDEDDDDEDVSDSELSETTLRAKKTRSNVQTNPQRDENHATEKKVWLGRRNLAQQLTNNHHHLA
jgi:chromosome transmission fidelity protein 4